MNKDYISSILSKQDKLKISTSGIRGIVNEGLDLLGSVHFFLAFAEIVKRKVIIARDTRPSSEALSHLLISVLLAKGKKVLDLGITSTPNLKFTISQEEADAGVMITASHNSIEWNGMKFFTKGGLYFKSSEWRNWHKALSIKNNNGSSYLLQTKDKGSYQKISKVKEHVEAVLSMVSSSRVKSIQDEGFKVLIDSVGGTGLEGMTYLLEKLNCQVVSINQKMKGNDFPREAEPTVANLVDFTKHLKKDKFSIGFALDPDADRLVLGSSKKGAVDEEFTLPLSVCGLMKLYEAKLITNKRNLVVVVNRSTSTLTEQIARSMGFKVVYSAVGEANVVQKMQQKKAMLGGEGNGGVISADVPSFGRDPLVAVLLILYYMAHSRVRSIDPLLHLLPPLYMHKTQIQIQENIEMNQIYSQLVHYFRKGKIDRSDGLYISFSTQTWLHVRPSNTEPQVRLIAQGTSDQEVIDLLQQTRRLIFSKFTDEKSKS